MLKDREVVILSGARTPFGRFCGAFSNVSATDLGVVAAKGAIERAGIDAEIIDQVIFGNVLQSSPDAPYLARHVGLKAGVPVAAPALTVNRLCGSGFQSVISAAEQISSGQANFILAGGAENMTQAPHSIFGARTGLALGNQKLRDTLWDALTDSYTGLPMAITAENLASTYGITRDESDRFALRSQQLAAEATRAGKFADEIVPVEAKTGRGKTVDVAEDEHLKPGTTLEGLSKLPAVFRPGGLVTAGSASGICDGAAAVMVAAKDEAERRGLPYLGTVRAFGIAGCAPDQMGIGPVPASRLALNNFGKTLADIDLVEINEAFAPQTLSVERELGIHREKLNVNGGAIALGHPLGASGTRIMLTLLLELARRGKRWGLGSACIGGGQGISIIVESAGSVNRR